MPIEFAPPNPSLQGFQIPAPQSTDPLQTLAQIGQLRTQGLQQQVGQQELETGGIKLQQAREDMADQQKLRQVYQNWMQSGNPKVDDLLTQAGAAGVGPRTLMPLQQQITEQRLKLANAKEAEFKNIVSGQAQTTQGLNAVASVPPDQPAARAAAWQTERQNLLAGGFANPNEIPPDYPGDAAFEELRHHNRTQEQELAMARDAREAAASGATTTKTGLENVAATKQQLVSDIRMAPQDPNTGTPTPAAWQTILANPAYKGFNLKPQPTKGDIVSLEESTIPEKDLPAYRIELAKADAMKALAATSPQDLERQVDAIVPRSDPMNESTKVLLRGAISRGDFPAVQQIFKDAYDQRGRVQVAKESAQNKVNIDLGSFARQLTGGIGGGPGGPGDQHGEAYLSTLPPALAARVRGIMTGNEPLPTGRAANSGPGVLLTNAVYQADPNYTPLLGQKRKTELQDFSQASLPHAGGQAVALNTMIHHADLYMEAGEALKNGTWRPGNAAYNAVAAAFGKAPPLQADLVARFFAGETGKVATGGVPGEGEVNGILQNLKNSNSPQQIADAGKTLLGIAAGRMVPLQERIADAKLENLAPPLLGPSAKAILVRRGFDPNTMQPVKAGAAPKFNVGDSVMYQGKLHKITAIDPKTGKLTIDPQAQQ